MGVEMSQKTLLFVDIDGVLSRTLEPLLRFINMSSENGVQMTPRLIDEYNMCACIARVQPRFVQPVDELLHQPFLYSVLEPYTETVSALARHDGPIVFITARK